MKVAAHPLVVAVALGLLTPAALDDLLDDDRATPCAGCSTSGPASSVDSPDPVDVARVEAAWHTLDLNAR